MHLSERFAHAFTSFCLVPYPLLVGPCVRALTTPLWVAPLVHEDLLGQPKGQPNTNQRFVRHLVAPLGHASRCTPCRACVPQRGQPKGHGDLCTQCSKRARQVGAHPYKSKIWHTFGELHLGQSTT